MNYEYMKLPLWEICIPRIVQAEEILIGCFVECQTIKKVGGRRSVDGPFPPSRLNISPSETKIEPDRRLPIPLTRNSQIKINGL